MASYNYDEGGNMAAYFLLTFLALVLVPLTLSMFSGSKKVEHDGCQCQACVEQRSRINKREQGSWLNPRISKKSLATLAGWSFFGFIAYKVAGAKNENKLYDPFEILGLSSSVTEKEIKSHFKKLSKLYHPDKVKADGNNTIEDIANKFVEITKAYKSLTDETIRRNWQEWNNPDGRQEVSTGIALPSWIVEGKNNIWVLGVYGLIFGGALPALVGRWWFGSREKTKDGVKAQTAASFFKSLKEESSMTEVVGTLGKAYQWERSALQKSARQEIDALDAKISERDDSWPEIKKLADSEDKDHESRRRALVLLYAHLLRIPISNAALQKEQADVLLQTPLLLNALLNMSTARSWLTPSLAAMRLHAYLAQALPPGKEKLRFAQLPGVTDAEASRARDTDVIEDFVLSLEANEDSRTRQVKKAVETWGRLDLVDASFKVIGERVVTPSSIVFLVVKLRISPPSPSPLPPKEDADDVKASKSNEEKDNLFLNSKQDAEDLRDSAAVRLAHAPYWPGNRKPSWWLVLADDKSNKIVVPPMKISDVPYSDPASERDYRSYKLQFQAPQGTGLFTWRIYLVSDTFIGEEVTKDLALKIDDASVLNADDPADDEISEPEEDTLAGQMAAMRGGAVKKRQDDESDDESSTDEEEEENESSDSDDSD
ncbi:hypothetical protein PLICRDRAFT_170703 [Plicaturopsis crispa FD-325 SS-3]|nr:hypothetical protein PLICRDRAFT_170703 [Plicaturopsis crispa FD-325 SS-3]